MIGYVIGFSFKIIRKGKGKLWHDVQNVKDQKKL